MLAVDFTTGQEQLTVTSVADGLVTVARGASDLESGLDSKGNIGIYGQVVDDFHTINKDRIMATAVGALQEVSKTQQKHVATVAALESKIANFTVALQQQLENSESKIAALETQNSNLLLRLEALENP